MHSPSDCERCQRDLSLFGNAYFNGITDEHYDARTMVVAESGADGRLRKITLNAFPEEVT